MTVMRDAAVDRVLHVYVSAGCFACRQTPDAIAAIRTRIPRLSIHVVDVQTTHEIPASVFSVPTYTLDGITISLGNPTSDDIEQLAALLHNTNPAGDP